MDQLFWLIRKSILKLKVIFHTYLIYLSCSLIGIHIKPRSKFYGFTSFYKYPGSTIVVGENCRFRSTHFSNPVGLTRKNILSTLNKDANIIIGSNCGFSGVAISCAKKIAIGNNTLLGANVVITDTDWHPINAEEREKGEPAVSKEITIGDNVWIGINAIILKGVTIGDNSVIGANSVVSKDIPANSIAAGNPCRVLRILNNEPAHFTT